MRRKEALRQIILRFFIRFMFATQFAVRIRNLESSVHLISNYAIDNQKLEDTFKGLFSLLEIKEPQGQVLIRVGSEDDGGYILTDDFNPNQLAISLGVGRNVDAEYFLAKRGIKVIMFDGTIEKLPRQHKNFEFTAKNVCGKSEKGRSQDNLIEINRIFADVEVLLRSKVFHSEQLKLGPQLILLMDIEGSEYETILNIDEKYLIKCLQITVEFHNVFSELTNENSRLIECIKKLKRTHEIISVHGNNYGGSIQSGAKDYPDVIEISLLSKTSYEFTKGTNTFNHALSMPNNNSLRDLRHTW